MSSGRFDLGGRTALVTGAAHGLGRAIAIALAEAGADVALGLRDALWIATTFAISGFLWLIPSPIPAMRELPETLLTIGEVARRSGFPQSALRYYEREGLVSTTRTTGGQRRYETGRAGGFLSRRKCGIAS